GRGDERFRRAGRARRHRLRRPAVVRQRPEQWICGGAGARGVRVSEVVATVGDGARAVGRLVARDDAVGERRARAGLRDPVAGAALASGAPAGPAWRTARTAGGNSPGAGDDRPVGCDQRVADGGETRDADAAARRTAAPGSAAGRSATATDGAGVAATPGT